MAQRLTRRDALRTVGGMAAALAAARAAIGQGNEKVVKIGMIGLDTSHVIGFTGTLNKAKPGDEAYGAKVVAGFPGGSPDLPASATRVAKFTEQLKKEYGLEIVDSIPALIEKVDAVMVESVDGRPHLAQARPVFEARKRVFIDKPFTASIADAKEILRLSKEHETPFFSCSCYRFVPEIVALRKADVGEVKEVESTYTMSIEPHHPDLFWYGIHGVEALYTVMGPGCEWVERKAGTPLDITRGQWKDGRIGVFRGVRAKDAAPNGVVVRGAKGEKTSEKPKRSIYYDLMVAVVKFFQGGPTPIDPEETIEIVEFMTAAQLSAERNGARVMLSEVRK
ncbi:MAG: Gfo/Idh/MocA family oxidoreductase [Planctomycetota bacterium]